MSFLIEELNKNVYEITTPFIDDSNDYITVYAFIKGNKMTITDNGETISNLILKGKNLDVDEILDRFGVHRNKNEIYIKATQENFSTKIYTLIQALIIIYEKKEHE